MAFLAAGLPVLDVPVNSTPSLSGFEESRSLAFRSLDGADLIPFTGDEYVARWGITGLDVPPRDVVEQSYPNEDGADLDDITVGSRLWVIPLRVTGIAGHRAFLDQRARIRRQLSHRGVDYRTHGGTFDVVATSVLGQRALRSTYVAGLEGDWQQESSGSYFETVPLQGRSSRPYWTGERWTTPPIVRSPGYKWFGTFPPTLSSSRTLGADITISVPGDAAPWVRIDATGPAPYVEITGPGLHVLLPDGLAAGETLLINTYPPQRSVLINGLYGWGRLAPQRRWAPMTPGDNTFRLDLGNAGSGASATVSGPSLWETPW